VDAIDVLNSLIQKMPKRQDKISSLIQAAINQTNNDYPAFREISSKITSYRRDGYSEDPNRKLLEDIEQMQMDDIVDFYQSYVKGRTLVYVVVGNSWKIDMRKLATFGDIIRVRKKDFYR
jgi:hypothetical protein